MCNTPQPPKIDAEPQHRRGFLMTLLAGFAVLLWPWKHALAGKKLALPLSKLDALKKVGGGTTIQIEDQNVMLIRIGETNIRAFDPTCTHKKCSVRYREETGKIHCKCHKSAYDTDGQVLSGPAPRPLKRFRAAIRSDRVLLELPDNVVASTES